MIRKLRQIMCNHIFSVDISQDCMMGGDKHNKVNSGKIVLTCWKCEKEIIIYDKWFSNFIWEGMEEK